MEVDSIPDDAFTFSEEHLACLGSLPDDLRQLSPCNFNMVLRNDSLPEGFGRALAGALDKLHGKHTTVLLNEHGLAHAFATLCLKDAATGYPPQFASTTLLFLISCHCACLRLFSFACQLQGADGCPWICS